MSEHVSESPPRRLSSRQVATVERLLQAGLEELRAVGHEALTIRSVAQRAGVSPATAYTYLASKHHLFAELFWRHLATDPVGGLVADGPPVQRVQETVRQLADRIAKEPALAAAVTPALLSHDADVERLRLRIGADFLARFRSALGDAADDAVLDALLLAWTGALLQAGIGILTYDHLADRLEAVVATIVKGNV